MLHLLDMTILTAVYSLTPAAR